MYKPVIVILALSFLFSGTAHAFVNLPVPYTSQAPFGDWREPWKNACEETSITMIDYFYGGKHPGRTIEKHKARASIARAVQIKNNAYGKSLDENAKKIASLINNFFPYEAFVVENPTISQLKHEIDVGHPVIMVTYGKRLKNPYFVNGGSWYHVFVISGYDDKTKDFIVQEPGLLTKGLDYRYSYETIANAMHDYLPFRQTYRGRPRAVFTTDHLNSSLNSDGDKDGLTKEAELTANTSLWLVDSDGDGYSDGTEVKYGYSPRVNESKLTNGTLIKITKDPTIYLLENGAKRMIATEATLAANGWKTSNVVTVSEKFFGKLGIGKPIK